MELVDGVNFLWYVRGETYPAESGLTSGLSAATSAGLQAFFEQAPGGTGASSVPAGGALNLGRLRPMLMQLTEGVLALHDSGKLHRDNTPSHVLVTRDGPLALVDLGPLTEHARATRHTRVADGA